MIKDKFRGSLIGLAIGDALGAPIEFKPPGFFEPVENYRAGGPFELEAGDWTDDTSMALCSAISLTKREKHDPFDQMNRFCRWYKEGYMSSTGFCFDIGQTTRQSLDRFMTTKDPFSGSTNPNNAGNGSIMRLAPVPLFYSNDLKFVPKVCIEHSRLTHATEECLDACALLGLMIAKAASGATKEDILNCDLLNLSPLIDEIQSGSFKHKQPPEIKGTGYVVQSLEAALWAFNKADDFESAVLDAVNLGDDADTTAAICGSLAGAYYGFDELPKHLVDGLKDSDMILYISDGLYEAYEEGNN